MYDNNTLNNIDNTVYVGFIMQHSIALNSID